MLQKKAVVNYNFFMKFEFYFSSNKTAIIKYIVKNGF